MPYKSAKQAAYMHSQHPEIAKRWDREYGGVKDNTNTDSTQALERISGTKKRKKKGTYSKEVIQRKLEAMKKEEKAKRQASKRSA